MTVRGAAFKLLRRILQQCAEFSLGLMVVAKGAVPLVVILLLVAGAFGSRVAQSWIETLFAGYLLVALVLFYALCWFLPDYRKDLANERARREARNAVLVQEMQQPQYWFAGSVERHDRTPSLTSLREAGFEAAHVMTTARFLARKAVEKELLRHGIGPSWITRGDLNKAAEALLSARMDSLVAEAKTRMPTLTEPGPSGDER